MGIRRATKYLQIRIVYRLTGPYLLWNLQINYSWWRFVYQVCNCIDRLSLKWFGECIINSHALHMLQKCSVHPFCNSILLWCSRYSMVPHYTSILIELCKFFTTKFSTIVPSQSLDWLPGLLLDHGLPLLEFAEHFILFSSGNKSRLFWNNHLSE